MTARYTGMTECYITEMTQEPHVCTTFSSGWSLHEHHAKRLFSYEYITASVKPCLIAMTKAEGNPSRVLERFVEREGKESSTLGMPIIFGLDFLNLQSPYFQPHYLRDVDSGIQGRTRGRKVGNWTS